MKREDLNIFYMQLRQDPETCDEELQEFARFMELRTDQLFVWNVFHSEPIDTAVLDSYDALIAGGSSDDKKEKVISEPEDFPQVKNAKKLIDYAYTRNMPGFLSCMGFLFVNEYLGNTIIVDDKNMEEGYCDIFLTEEGKKDVLFQNIEESFTAVSFHKKRVINVREDCVLLASTKKCPVHVIRKKNAPFYAFQFHPEISRETLIAKLERYIERYFGDEKSVRVLQGIIDTCPDVPVANELAKTFVDAILLKKSM